MIHSFGIKNEAFDRIRAGGYRLSDKNIGVSWQKIPEEMLKLCEDTSYWIEHKSHGWDEIGARFHHRLVSIHPFPNGNGRHARLMADVLLEIHGQEAFSWGQSYLEQADGGSKIREHYLTALREADSRKFEKLMRFVRS